MSIAMSVEKYLTQMQVPFDVLTHDRTSSSLETARVAQVSVRLAKGVLLEDGAGYLLAVVPASEHVHLGRLGEQLGCTVGLATEREAMALFEDCATGAIPPLGAAYGLRTLL